MMKTNSIPDFLINVARDEKAVVAPAVAAIGVALVAAAGLALDLGLYYTTQRDLRSATEAAALSAAVEPTRAQERAINYLQKNGYPASVLKNWEVGYYCANVKPAYPAGSRFVTVADRDECPGSSVENAVRLTTEQTSRRFLTPAVGLGDAIPKATSTASAARIDEAGISITTGLLTITNNLVTVVNNLLGALLGIQLRLDTNDVEALMGGNIDAGRFFDALATKTHSSGTYSELMLGTYDFKDIVEAAADAAYKPQTAAALRTIAAAVKTPYQVSFTQNGVPLFGLGIWKHTPVGSASSQQSLRAGLNAYQLVTYAAQLGPGVIDLSKVVNLVIPGSRVEVAVMSSGLLDRPRFAFGPAGETSVGTSMLRLSLDVQLQGLNLLGLVGTSAHVPLILDVAAASAKIADNGINCQNSEEQKTETSVTVTTNSGLVNLYVGKLKKDHKPSSQMTPLTANDFTEAKFFDLNVRLLGIPLLSLAKLQGKLVVSPLIGATNQDVAFGFGGEGAIGGEDVTGSPVVVSNRSSLEETISGLSNSLLASGSLESCTIEFICIGANTQAISNLREVLNRTGFLLGNIADPLLDQILAALGVQLGHATVWVNGVRCGVPVLI